MQAESIKRCDIQTNNFKNIHWAERGVTSVSTLNDTCVCSMCTGWTGLVQSISIFPHLDRTITAHTKTSES